jgi:hypothetical protein
MTLEVEVSDEFQAWYLGLRIDERASVASCVGMI